jgi:hypothetical protein
LIAINTPVYRRIGLEAAKTLLIGGSVSQVANRIGHCIRRSLFFGGSRGIHAPENAEK